MKVTCKDCNRRECVNVQGSTGEPCRCSCSEPYEIGSGARCDIHEKDAPWRVATHCEQCGARSTQDCADGGQCDHLSGAKPMIDHFPGNRKGYPVLTGLLLYFPDACAEVANCSYKAGEQHHPGEPMHWERGKSIGEGDELVRHLMQKGSHDTDGVRHLAKAAWRALELLQREIEAERAKDEEDYRNYQAEVVAASRA